MWPSWPSSYLPVDFQFEVTGSHVVSRRPMAWIVGGGTPEKLP